MSQETLRASRLELLSLSDDHLDYEVDLDSDPEVMRYLVNGRARTPEEVHSQHQARLTGCELPSGRSARNDLALKQAARLAGDL